MSDDIIKEIDNLSKEDLEIILQQKSHLFSKEELDAIKKKYSQFSDTSDILKIDKTLISELKSCGMGGIDEYTNTRLLLGIYKSVNFMRNVLIVGLIVGAIAIIINLIS